MEAAVYDTMLTRYPMYAWTDAELERVYADLRPRTEDQYAQQCLRDVAWELQSRVDGEIDRWTKFFENDDRNNPFYEIDVANGRRWLAEYRARREELSRVIVSTNWAVF